MTTFVFDPAKLPSAKALTTYLNDHLAGSVAALELLEHLIESKAGTPDDEFFTSVRDEITVAQKFLRELLRRRGEDESNVRKATAWIIEKFSHLKLQLSGPSTPEKGLLEALEALVLGITGQCSLWRALAVLETIPGWEGIDFVEWEERAERVRQRVERRRLEVAPIALRVS